jgi:hypothetical protein
MSPDAAGAGAATGAPDEAATGAAPEPAAGTTEAVAGAEAPGAAGPGEAATGALDAAADAEVAAFAPGLAGCALAMTDEMAIGSTKARTIVIRRRIGFPFGSGESLWLRLEQD